MFEAARRGTRNTVSDDEDQEGIPDHRIRAFPNRGCVAAYEAPALFHSPRRQKRGLHGIDRGGKRNRQGPDGSIPTLFQHAPRWTVCRAQLFNAIPETLLESELFGREAGAYTDARSQKKGLLEVANGGTLFLDEIGDLSPGVQAKFLRVLEQQSFRRLGGVQDITVDLRVVAATNRDLSGAVQNGTFRLDLFHRLSVIQIAPPPLRDHAEDILPLASNFVQEHNRRYKAHIQGISPDAAKILETYLWPGDRAGAAKCHR